jgi:hypothetical protein
VQFTDWQLKVVMMRNAHNLLKSRFLPGLSLLSILTVTVAVRSNHLIELMPACPIKALTGIDCPACGSVRCVQALANGNLWMALDQNLLVSILLAFGTLGLVMRTVRGEKFLSRIDFQRSLIALSVFIPVFWVIRMLPLEIGEWLSSGIYHQ